MDGDVAVKKILAPIDRSKYKEGKLWGAEITTIQVIDPGRGIPGGRIKEKELERGKGKKPGTGITSRS
jgi:hypothetical protein